jgi:hypothetical protein
VKHLIVMGILSFAAGDAFAQGSDINSRWGPSGSHFTLSSSTQSFLYEATISGMANPYEVKLQVFHNGVLKLTDVKPVHIPFHPFLYSCPVGMGAWGLQSGDTVTFVLTVTDMATGAVLGTHCLIGDVAGT